MSANRGYIIQKTLHDVMMQFIDPNTSTADSPIPKAERESYREAAETWRLPYWDFANMKPYNNEKMSIPKCFSTGDLTQMGHASDTLKIIAPQWLTYKHNPLYTFEYPFKGQSPANFGLKDVIPPENFIVTLQTDSNCVMTDLARLQENHKICF